MGLFAFSDEETEETASAFPDLASRVLTGPSMRPEARSSPPHLGFLPLHSVHPEFGHIAQLLHREASPRPGCYYETSHPSGPPG